MRIKNLLLLAGISALVACGDDSSNTTEKTDWIPEVRDLAATDPNTLDLTGSRSCDVDGDCAAGQMCFQGTCAISGAVANPGALTGPAPTDLALNATIIEKPDRLQRVKSGQTAIPITFKLGGTIPTGDLAYRIERSDDDSVPQVKKGTITGDSVTISVPTGDANPAVGEAEAVFVNLVTAAGTVRLTFSPDLPADGEYGGEVVITTFGQVGLPIEFSIVTDPAGVSIDDADAAYVVLPVESGNLWNPVEAVADGNTHITVPLEFEPFTQTWVAQFRNAFHLPATSPLAWVTEGDTNAVSRRIRLELTFAGKGIVTGKVSDRWSGLFEARSGAGVLEPRDIAFEGTIEATRIAIAPAIADVTPPSQIVPEPAGLLPLPVTTQCTAFSFVPFTSCAGNGIANEADFRGATPDIQAACALEVAQSSLAAGTTASQISDFLDDNTPNPNGQSFADFMRDCAAQTNGTCVPSTEVLCSRQLVALSLKNSPEASPFALDLLSAYQDTTREAYLGRQFAAFHADAQTRLDWLEAQDYPAIVTSAVQSLVQGLLSAWQTNVLDAHLAVVRGQFDPSASAVLGQQIVDADALSTQRLLLMETTQSWRGAADALALGADRWDTLLTDPQDRTQQALAAGDQIATLYLVAGLLSELNRQAGAGANNAVFAGGFAPLARSVRRLGLPFDRLIFERQGEVVISTSLDPQSGNDELLSRLKNEAMAEVSDASDSVTAVIADSQAALLKEAELTSRIVNEVDSLEADLVDLCGMPQGCTSPDEGACRPKPEAGSCGFITDQAGSVIDSFPSDANPSEAGDSVLRVKAALLELGRVEEALRAHGAKIDLYYETTEVFAQSVEGWNDRRAELTDSIFEQADDLKNSNDTALQTLATNVQAQMTERQTDLAAQKGVISRWKAITVSGAAEDLNDRREIARTRGIANGLNRAGTLISATAKAAADGLPKSAGTANDVTGPARLALRLKGAHVHHGLKIAAFAINKSASAMERELQQTAALRSADLEEIKINGEIASATSEAAVEDLRSQAGLIQTSVIAEQGAVAAMIQALEQETEAALAYERDLSELRDRRDEIFARLIENDELFIQVLQAELAVDQAVNHYSRVVQRAELLDGRLTTVRNQLQSINQLIGSPTAVFAWANQLNRAEQRLERAKGSLRNWLVAIEYFAVRPFFDLRIQLLLARNTAQLEQIAAEILRLQNSCGGAVNTESVEVSLRKDLLGITQPIEDLQTNEMITPQQRFLEVLESGRIPIDKRVRYRSDATVGDLLNRGGVLAATFDVGMNDFANLASTCNAKMKSVSLQLVGEGLGDARPTVSVLYDGTSRMRSCQPDIKNIVELVGADVTPFNEVTVFKTSGRSISPTAGIGEFAPSNQSLGGLPVASQYTVLIDPTLGENSKIDWTKLDDILLKVEYNYQDLFPPGQCQ